jgi:hypothetical protein
MLVVAEHELIDIEAIIAKALNIPPVDAHPYKKKIKINPFYPA